MDPHISGLGTETHTTYRPIIVIIKTLSQLFWVGYMNDVFSSAILIYLIILVVKPRKVEYFVAMPNHLILGLPQVL